MNVKKVRRRCGIRGCRNTESYALVKGREHGGSVIICADCIKDAYHTIIELEQKENSPKVSSEDKKYICPDCGKEYATEKGLKQHLSGGCPAINNK